MQIFLRTFALFAAIWSSTTYTAQVLTNGGYETLQRVELSKFVLLQSKIRYSSMKGIDNVVMDVGPSVLQRWRLRPAVFYNFSGAALLAGRPYVPYSS
jgi:hypothetical protein